MKSTTIAGARSLGSGGMLVRTWRALRSPKTPLWKKAAFAAALVYLALPIDAVPDILPLVGWLDDAGMLALAVSQLLRARDGSP